jgi:hypothetical protein
MFQIWETQPVYCQITDGQIGSTSRPLPMVYRSEALARKLAARIETEHYENCGDGSFSVVPVGMTPSQYRSHLFPPAWKMDGEPFPF